MLPEIVRNRYRIVSGAAGVGWRAAPVVVLLCLALLGCGYQMAGSGSLPGGVQTVSVHTLENRTEETNLGTTMTNALIAELNRRRKGVLENGPRADAVLAGKVVSLSRRTISRRTANTTAERRVTIRIALTLTSADGTVLWQNQNLQDDQAYAVEGEGSETTAADLNAAIDRLTRRLAETIVRQLTENF
ncbi:MAG: LPS assembly lipoprotein LptE [Desulfosarcinaceae bacterium]